MDLIDALWNRSPNRGKGSRIALLDTGIDLSNSVFNGADILTTDLVSPGSKGNDIDGHGTSCASIILTIAPNCTLLSGRIMDRSGSFTYDCLIGGLFWASTHKADIICICSGDREADTLVEKKISELAAAYCITVAAVGNHGRQGMGAGLFPARGPGSFAIGTANTNGELSYFTDVPAEKPVYCLPGEEFPSASLGGSHQLITGTSASAAALAGVLGLVVSGRNRAVGMDWEEVMAGGSSKCNSPRGDYMLVDPMKLFSAAV
jgi:subtilisin family serine protease